MTSLAGLKEITVMEKDLGILVDDLRFHKQVAATVKVANQILGMIKRTFTPFDCQLLTKLYCALVTAILECVNSI